LKYFILSENLAAKIVNQKAPASRNLPGLFDCPKQQHLSQVAGQLANDNADDYGLVIFHVEAKGRGFFISSK
jgi:hypothetical protein